MMQLKWYHYIIYDLRLRLALYKVGRAFNGAFDSLLIFLRLKKEPFIRLEGWTGKMYVSSPYLRGVLIDASRSNEDKSTKAKGDAHRDSGIKQ